MALRRINPNIVKLHWTYDVPELAARCGVHKNTVTNWRKQGLEPIDGARPILFLGSAVRDFLKKRNMARKQPCGPGLLYCFRCREPRAPALGLIEYVPRTANSGNVRAFCGRCETLMHRSVSRSALATLMPGLDVQIAVRPLRLTGSTSPSLNCDSERQEAA
jgi:hypothetical protein